MCFGGGGSSAPPPPPPPPPPLKPLVSPEQSKVENTAVARDRQNGRKSLRIDLGTNSQTPGAGLNIPT